MEPNTNTSRIGIEIGAPLDGNEKSHIKAALKFGKGAAESQIEKLKAFTGTEDPNLSLVVVFTPAPGKGPELETIIKDIFDGKIESGIFSDAAKLFSEGLADYKVIHSGSNVVLHIKPGAAIGELVSQQIEAVLGLGIEALASTDQASVHIHLASAVDFHDVLEYHKKNYSTPVAFWKSSVVEVLVKSLQGSELNAKLLGILKQVVPAFSSTPLPFLQFLKTVDIDFSFKDIEDLPDKYKQWFGTGGEKAVLQFPRIKESKEEFSLYKKITEVLESSVDVYATLDKVAAVHLSVKLPGFGVALGTPYELNKV